MPHPCALVAAPPKPSHDLSPGVRDELGFLGGEIGFGEHQIQQRLVDRVVFGLNDFVSLDRLLGAQTLLLSRGAVFAIVNGSTPKQFCIFVSFIVRTRNQNR